MTFDTLDLPVRPPETVAAGFTAERADAYAEAGRASPDARENETVQVRAALDHLSIRDISRVVELGTGQGFGTKCLLDRLANDGTIYGIDASSFMLDHANPEPRLHRHAGSLDQLQIERDSIDFAFSLAAFHHIPNKWLVLEEVRRVLKPGAAFLIVDVTHDTEAQRCFDYIVRPYCSAGHDADFLDEPWATVLAQRANLSLESVRIERTDWVFDDEERMLAYARSLFCLELSTDEVRPLLKQWLKPYQADDGKWIMPWSLGFYVLRKA
jgi:SAM-dependent methyltransferase